MAMSSFKGRYSFHKPGRRSAGMGMRLPVRKPTKHAAVVIMDTSGSISDQELTQFLTESSEIMRACGAPKIHIYFHDVNCYHHEEYTRETINKVKVTRRGTSHIDVFEKVIENEEKVGMVVAFTDLATSFPPEEPPFPVLWAHPPSGDSYGVPWGQKIRVELME
jgi:predicted metal-dependent peptidase